MARKSVSSSFGSPRMGKKAAKTTPNKARTRAKATPKTPKASGGKRRTGHGSYGKSSSRI